MLFRHATTLSIRSLLPLAAVILLCAAIAAQNQQSKQANNQDNVLRIETELVQIDMVVTDKQGKLVRDLQRENFELLEDGKKQPITHFAVGTSAQPARWLTTERKRSSNGQTTDTTVTETLAGRYIVLAVDDFHLATENLLTAKSTLIKFINEQMVAGDQVAVVTTSGNIGLFQQFTRERPVLQRAINRLSVQNRSATSPFDIPRITDYQAELIDRGDRDALEMAVQEILRLEPTDPNQQQQGGGGGRSGQTGGGNGTQPDGAESPARNRAISQVQTRARMIVAENASYTRTTLTTLEKVIRSLTPLPGRKLIVLLSDGFYLGGNSSSQIFDMRRITDAATRAGVVIYSIDARGLATVMPGGDASEGRVLDPQFAGIQARMESATIEARRSGLYALAADTGGKVFFDSNDLNLGLQRVLDDNETYYVLAYEPEVSRRDGRFHKIEVRIVNHPDSNGLKVRTRKGYFATEKTLADKRENDEKPKNRNSNDLKSQLPERTVQLPNAEKVKQMVAGLASLFPIRDIPVEMAVDFVNTQKGSFAVVNTHIDSSNLSFEQTGNRYRTSVDLSGVIFDESGKPAASFGDKIALNLSRENFNQLVKNGFNYRRLEPLKPGFYQARIAVREERTSNMGSAADWVEIPDLKDKKLTLSGILLSSGNQKVSDLQNTSNESEYKPRPSSATRKFKSGGDMDFLVFAYNPKVEKNSVDLIIQSQVFAGSKLIYASPPARMSLQPDADLQRVPYAARVSLDNFDPGEYELRLMVIDRLTKATAYRQVNFTVE